MSQQQDNRDYYEGAHRGDNNGRDLLLAGVVVFGLSLAALVVLSLNNRDTSELMALVGPVVAALLVTGHVNRVTGQQNQQLQRTSENVQKVREQTNGVLDRRIRQQTTQALADAGLIPPAGPVHVDLDKRPATDAGRQEG